MRHSSEFLARTCLVGLGFALASCAVGPDYARPDLGQDAPDAWHQELARGLENGDADLQRWWTLLGDPVLLDLVDRASGGNLDLQQAAARVAAARGQRGIALGEWFPALDSETSYQRGRQSEEALGPLGGIENDLYSTGLAASWEVDLFGRIRRSVEASDADLAAAFEDYRDLLVVLYAELATSYVEVRALQKRIRYNEDNIAAQLDTLELVRVRNRVGLVGDLDLRQAELNLARTESLLPVLREALALQLNRIAVLTGAYPAELPAELRAPAPIPDTPERIAVGLPHDLLRQRPDLRRAERALAAQTARIGVATADLYPRLTLAGTFSFDATSTADWFTNPAQSYGFGPQIRWNLFDGGRIRSNVRTQEALAQLALAAYEQAVLLAAEDVEDALASWVQESARVEKLRASAAAASSSVGLVQTLYKSGLVDFQNVLDSERSLFQQQDSLAESEGRLVQNLIRIYRALGGGWTP